MKSLARALAVGWIVQLLMGCAVYTGSSRQFDTQRIATEPGWVRVEGVPVVYQKHNWDCGLAALSMVLKFWSIAPDADRIAKSIGEAVETGRAIRAAELRSVAKAHEVSAFLFHGRAEDIEAQLVKGRPLIVGVEKPTTQGPKSHYEVIIAVNPRRRTVVTIDPSAGYRENTFEDFDTEWSPTGRLTLLVFPKRDLAKASESHTDPPG